MDMCCEIITLPPSSKADPPAMSLMTSSAVMCSIYCIGSDVPNLVFLRLTYSAAPNQASSLQF